MSAISGFINQIQNAVYGEQVRTAIVNALLACYSDVENPDLQSAAFQTAIENAYEDGILDITTVTSFNDMTNQNIIYRYNGTAAGKQKGLYYYSALSSSWVLIGSEIQKVSLLSQMTDTNDIYKYIGTESGMVQNSLYCHNGTAWVPIGSGILTASTAAQMTNQNAIYKYTGNETGYITNALYYYKGTAWVTISAPTDKTLTQEDEAADAKAVGDEIERLESALYKETEKSFTVSGQNTAPSGYTWLTYFDANTIIQRLSFTPLFATTGETGTWTLYETTDGQPAARGSALTQVDTGTFTTGNAITFNTFTNKNVIGISGANPMYTAAETAAHMGLYEKGGIRNFVYGSIAGAYEATVLTPIADLINPTSTKTVFKGKTAAFYGDSLTEENNHYTKGYYDWLAENLELGTVSNYGVSGYKIADVITKMQSTDDASAMVFVMVGTNDTGGNTPIGTPSDTTTGTVYGNLDVLCNLMRTKYPTSFLCMITPHYQTKYGSQSGTTSALAIANAMKTVCERYCIPVYDNRVLSQMFAGNLDNYTTDGCHWNNNGHKLVGQNLTDWIKSNYTWFYFKVSPTAFTYETLKARDVTCTKAQISVDENGTMTAAAISPIAMAILEDVVAIKGTHIGTTWIAYKKNDNDSYNCVQLYSIAKYCFNDGSTQSAGTNSDAVTVNSTPTNGSTICMYLDSGTLYVTSEDGSTVYATISGAEFIGFFISSGGNATNFPTHIQIAKE